MGASLSERGKKEEISFVFGATGENPTLLLLLLPAEESEISKNDDSPAFFPVRKRVLRRRWKDEKFEGSFSPSASAAATASFSGGRFQVVFVEKHAVKEKRRGFWLILPLAAALAPKEKTNLFLKRRRRRADY